MLHGQKNYAPLPTHLQNPSSWTHLSSDELEIVVRRLHEIHRTWLLPTVSGTYTLTLDTADTVLYAWVGDAAVSRSLARPREM